MTESHVLTYYKCPYNKIRLGKDYDGGYIIADIPNINYKLFLSGGLGEDISFEEDFIKKYPNIKCIAYDGTIDGLPNKNNNIQFIKKNIIDENNEQNTNLHDIIYDNESIFLKMDIECGEVPWLKSLSDEQINKFDQIVIEFHNIPSDKDIDIFHKINKNHYLIHFHGNNHDVCDYDSNNVLVPKTFECTYLHKKFFEIIPELNTDIIPNKIDMRNWDIRDEIYIDYPPFVNNI